MTCEEPGEAGNVAETGLKATLGQTNIRTGWPVLLGLGLGILFSARRQQDD